MSTRLPIAGIAAAAIIVLTACTQPLTFTAQPTPLPSAPPVPSTPPSPASPAPVVEYAEAAQLAAQLPLIDRSAQIPDYRRATFGDGWATDAAGCSIRQVVLARDLVDVLVDVDGCTVLTGTLRDPYTATDIAFTHDRLGGDSQAVQIDHIVSLSAAHAGGAWAWTSEHRELFANDLAVLIAVDGPTNASKGDRGPSDWMPPSTAYACLYALDYVTIVADYQLAVDAADRDTLLHTLTECAG